MQSRTPEPHFEMKPRVDFMVPPVSLACELHTHHVCYFMTIFTDLALAHDINMKRKIADQEIFSPEGKRSLLLPYLRVGVLLVP